MPNMETKVKGTSKGMNHWKEIWAKHSADEGILKKEDERYILLELKRSSGFDVFGGITYENWMEWYRQVKRELSLMAEAECGTMESVFEVGCGSGANLYLLERDGMQCGGLDFSENLMNSAKTILKTKDLLCDEAIRLPAKSRYDVVFSNSFFSYFTDQNYAEAVLEKMYQKTRYGIGLLDIHDKEKEEDFIAYRERTVENYKEKYKNLPKLFYTKEFFLDFASRHHADIKFTFSGVKGYWNNDFIFNCYIYKKKEG